MNTKHVVFDTNVLVSALLSREGNPAKIYRMFLTKAIRLIYCEEILAEYEDVLYRPHLRIPQNNADTVMTAIRQYAEKIEITPSEILMTDEDDRVFYDVAKLSGAYLITGNIKHYPTEPFILTPTAFLELK